MQDFVVLSRNENYMQMYMILTILVLLYCTVSLFGYNRFRLVFDHTKFSLTICIVALQFLVTGMGLDYECRDRGMKPDCIAQLETEFPLSHYERRLE